MDNGKSVATLEDGRRIVFYPENIGTLIHPARGDVGEFAFPLRSPGDALRALIAGKPLPPHCKGW